MISYITSPIFQVFGKSDNKESKNNRSPIRENRYGTGQNVDDPGRVTKTKSGSKTTGLSEADMSSQLEQLQSLANSMKEGDSSKACYVVV